MPKFQDDKFEHLERDIDKMRGKHRMYLSFSNELAAKAICLEILFNAIDECRNPRSPADTIGIRFDERSGCIQVEDNGRGIPTDKLELILTTLNSGSNISGSDKMDLNTSILGRNGVGTLAMVALAARVEVISYRGGSENVFKRLVFVEGEKVSEETDKCDAKKHGLSVTFEPSKILGKNTRIVWKQIHDELVNIQFLTKHKINITSVYIDKHGNPFNEKYKIQPFESILSFKNSKESILGDKIQLNTRVDGIKEEIGGKSYSRFIDLDIAFVYTSSMNPYIDSFCNSNNTIDAGSHLDATFEALSRYFQQVTKSSLSEKEKGSLDIKWDDVKTGLSLVVSLNTNFEQIFTSQTKHKVSSEDLEQIIKDEVVETLKAWGDENPSQLKDITGLVKMNAKVRREGEKVRNAVVKENVTNWGQYKMENYDPCTNRGREYKELYIIEGKSAKGSLKLARDPKFQALFAIRGVSANVFKLDLNGILANKEFNDLIKVMGCNVGTKFDLSKLVFDKIIIASDADVDGLFIRSLLLSFFFKVYPEIISDGRLFIAEPPLYRTSNKKNPFVVNREDYVNRYIDDVVKNYQVEGVLDNPPKNMTKSELKEFLSDTSSYVDETALLAQHYKVNERLVETILINFAQIGTRYFSKSQDHFDPNDYIGHVNIQRLMNSIGVVFKEVYFDDEDQLIKGIIDGKYQSIELTERLVRKGFPLIEALMNYGDKITLKEIKTGTTEEYSMLEALKILRKYQPDIVHRFKGLGENDADDVKSTIMDPNTRMLIRVHISTIENDMKVFSVLRGSSPIDAQARKTMMREFIMDKDLIDT